MNKQEVVLAPSGILKSKRLDGITFFGLSKETDLDSANSFSEKSDKREENKVQCDVQLNPSILMDLQGKIPNPLFAINYSIEYNDFYFNYCKKNKNEKSKGNFPSILLIKLDMPLILKKTETISIGNTFFEIKADKKELSILRFEKNEDGSITKTNYSFNGENTKEVTIGRDSKANISIDNKSFSKINATIKYYKITLKQLLSLNSSNKQKIYSQIIESDASENTIIKFWELIDGSPTKKSTYGVWLFSAHSYRIYDGFTFRLGKNKVKIDVFNDTTIK